MTTLNGFLTQAIGETPRMTAGQKDIVLRGARAALEDTCPMGVATGILIALDAAMGSLPSFRGCLACDYFFPEIGNCRHWKSDVPKDVRPKGCDEFQDVGAPF